jgi:signal transduction histidine kinase
MTASSETEMPGEGSADETVMAVLAVAAHELKSPLTGLRGNLQLIQRQIKKLAEMGPDGLDKDGHMLESIQDHLRRALLQTMRMTRWVQDVMESARYETGQFILRLAPIDLRALIEGVLVDYQEALGDRLVTRMFTSDSTTAYGDAERLAQVVANLLTNALKYTPAGSPLTVGLARIEKLLCIWVEDHGPGIPAEDREHIWSAFYRVPGRIGHAGIGAGLGLGLSLCRSIVEAHQGTVGLENTPGGGATFWFTVPAL